jgi:hypothetical protein
MADASRSRGPRFTVGQTTKVATPGIHTGKRGVLAEIIQPRAGDYVYRYRVRFPDGSSGTFFGFELEVSDEQSPKPKK